LVLSFNKREIVKSPKRPVPLPSSKDFTGPFSIESESHCLSNHLLSESDAPHTT
jgi:hypothetical protein